MARSSSFGARSTADQVLAGIDLTGKRFVVTGCGSGIGFESMCALSANGATVYGLARSLHDAEIACAKAGPAAIPVACDLADLDSIAAAAGTMRGFGVPLDAIIANAGIAHLPLLQTRYGVEMQFLVNHIGHFALVNQIHELVRNGTGRIVIVSSSAAIHQAPAAGILFDNLDGRRFYDASQFYGQSKLANALHAMELSRRLGSRGIAVNAVHPGNARGTLINRHARLTLKAARWAAHWLLKSPQQAAATQALLAANPGVGQASGEFWSDCRIAAGAPLLKDSGLAARLWEVSEEILARQAAPAGNPPLREAA
jgi:WW domain-containing oxidoreductase